MTDQRNLPPALGEVLDRIYRATCNTHQVTTDGRPLDPLREVELLGAELGYARHADAVRLLGAFTLDEDGAKHLRRHRLEVAMRAIEKAGASAEDAATLREALGLERDPEIEAWAADIDAANERTHRHWVEQYQRSRAVELANARQNERRRVIKELIESSGDSELRNFPGQVLADTKGGIDDQR